MTQEITLRDIAAALLTRVVWPRVYEYRHPEADEVVILRRHRLTHRLRRTVYREVAND
jgi:hypothetical protein